MEQRNTLKYRFSPTLIERIRLLFAPTWELNMDFSEESEFTLYAAYINGKKGDSDGTAK